MCLILSQSRFCTTFLTKRRKFLNSDKFKLRYPCTYSIMFPRVLSFFFMYMMTTYLYLLRENSKLNLFKETLHLKKSDINFVSVKCIYWFCYFIMFSFLLILECNIWNVIFVFKIQVILYIYKLSE